MNTKPERDFSYVDSSSGLDALCERLDAAEVCAIDTEFVRESTYYPVLALIQVATESEAACVDPLAIDDLSPLAEQLLRPGLLKVFHSPSQDLEILYQKFGQVPAPLFDTQLAAAVLGFNHQISYADLVAQLTGVVLEKKHTRADWTRRPLAPGELDYAMDDVRYLLPVYRELLSRLESDARLGWIEKDLAAMSDPKSYEVDEASLWQRLRGVQKLRGERLQIASELCRWREQVARERNRPRRWIVKDDALIEIARRKPDSIDELAAIPELGGKLAERHGKKLLRIVADAGRSDPSNWPRHEKTRSLDTWQTALGDCLMAICRVAAEENSIALATLATRKDIDNLILSQKSSRLMQGWRFAMVGERLLKFVHGQSCLRVEDNHLSLDD
ncbi:MAG: ribonuclease D [Gammaproteobacteria bacterium]|nr:ribonuclease D [Gammaproteobacteria bacterium]